MAKKATKKSSPAVELTGDTADLLDFWRKIVQGRMTVEDDSGATREIIVPLEVRIRASELLAKHVIPKNARIIDPADEDLAADADAHTLAQVLENKFSDEVLAKAFEYAQRQKREA